MNPGVAPPESKTLAEIRADVGNTTLVGVLGAGLLGVTVSLSRILEVGWKPVMALHIAVVGVLAVLVWLRKQLPPVVRSTIIVVLMFAIGIGGNVSFGLPAGILFFISGSIMAAVFFGERVGFACIGLTIVLQTIVFLAFKVGLLIRPDYAAFALAPTTWISNASAAVVAAIGPLIAVSRFTYHLDLERRRAEAASSAKSDFLAVMSHELRTPLTAILGFADLMMVDNLTQQQADRVSKISTSGKLLLDLLNDVLDFSKIDAQRLQLEQVSFSLREVMGEAHDLMLPPARQKKLDCRLDYAQRLPDTLIGDPARLRQVMLNLVSNAIKFTARGRVAVHISQRAEAVGKQVLLVQVADTSIGISPEQQAKLFQPLVQVDQGTARRYGCTGLGLTICRRLVELMGGEISISSKEGEGATFTFTMPLLENRAIAFTKLAGPVALPIRTNARVLGATLKAGETIAYALGAARKGYLVPAKGAVEINGVRIDTRDGAAIDNEADLKITALEDAEVVMVDAA